MLNVLAKIAELPSALAVTLESPDKPPGCETVVLPRVGSLGSVPKRAAVLQRPHVAMLVKTCVVNVATLTSSSSKQACAHGGFSRVALLACCLLDHGCLHARHSAVGGLSDEEDRTLVRQENPRSKIKELSEPCPLTDETSFVRLVGQRCRIAFYCNKLSNQSEI